jgi:threonylcarbamoyladenosine tRNA methylthiotransferase MtaB
MIEGVTTEVIAHEDVARRAPSATPSVAVLTIGCKLNQAESEAMVLQLAAAGCRVSDRPGPADAVVINTCAVTHVAERKARHLVRMTRRLSPRALIIVTGCYADATASAALAALGADVVLGNEEKQRAAAAVLHGFGYRGGAGASGRLRTRSFVKIQEGCNDVCAFCIVPQTRGRERSVPAADVLRATGRAESDGVKEVVLTGTQLGAYGHDLAGGSGLVALVDRVLRETSIPRIRLSSVQPQDVTPALLDLWSDPRLCRHFHVPLQSGSDAVLARMRRRYTAREFAEAVDAIRQRLPDASVTTDVIVGFPGETDEDFAATARFCRRIGFAALHVFPFSARPGTLAARMPDQVSAATKRARVREMLALSEELHSRFLARFQASVADVLFERRVRDNAWEGLTGNYIRVVARSDGPLDNRVAAVRLDRREAGGFRGVLQPDAKMR